MRSFVLMLALAVPAAAASATPYTTTDPHPLSRMSTQGNHTQWIRMTFRNTTLKGRVLTIGANQFNVPAGRTLDLAVATGSFRLSGKATIEGQVQRALAAPFDGFIASAPHRAGDVVEAGDLIAALDTRDLELEALRDESQRDEARLKAQAAQGKHNMADAAVEDAHAAEAEAELAVVREKIARAHLRAPFRGMVVSGDLSQKLGSPAEKGKILFEVAPLEDYRVVVKVDERDLSYVKPGQTARLVLNGIPGRPLDFTVDRVVPVAEAEDGKNAFRVEGPLQVVDEQLRPGMEGIAKIENGDASLVWIWSRPILAWTRLQIWKWWP